MKNGDYYGPFASASAVNKSLNQLQRIFMLRDCSGATFETRTRPCLQFQIRRCSAPCVGNISERDYAGAVKNAQNFLNGRTKEIQEALAKEMQIASEKMEFEKAAGLRDRIRALTHIQSSQGINPKGVNQADVIGLYMDGAHACIQVFFIRGNQNWGNSDFYPRISADNSHEEILEAFIGQFYSNKEVPKQLILSHNVEKLEFIRKIFSQKNRGIRLRL